MEREGEERGQENSMIYEGKAEITKYRKYNEQLFYVWAGHRHHPSTILPKPDYSSVRRAVSLAAGRADTTTPTWTKIAPNKGTLSKCYTDSNR